MKSECVVVSNGGSLFLVGPTGKSTPLTLLERIGLALTNRYPQRALDAVQANDKLGWLEPTRPTVENISRSDQPGRGVLNITIEQLYCIANPAPYRGDVMLHAYMPGHPQFAERLAGVDEGKPDCWKATAYWSVVGGGVQIEPTPFVFAAMSSDPTFHTMTGLDHRFLYYTMVELARQFGHAWNASSPTKVVLKNLHLDGSEVDCLPMNPPKSLDRSLRSRDPR